MDTYPADKFKDFCIKMHDEHLYPRDRAFIEVELWRDIRTFYETQIAALEKQVEALKADYIYAELLKIRNLLERLCVPGKDSSSVSS